MPDSVLDFDQTVAALTERARNAAEDFKSIAAETEKNRRVPDANLARLAEEGLLRVI